MTEGTRPNAMPKPEGSGADILSDDALESAAFAGAAAVQRLVADRNGLRNRLLTQDRELMGLRAAHEDLRRRVVTLQQNHVELAKRIVSQLEQFDTSIRDLLQEGHHLSAHNGRGNILSNGDATVTKGAISGQAPTKFAVG